jgi:hypothetical protein
MSSPRKRETVLTVWLTLLLAANIAGTLLYVFLAIYPAGFAPFFPELATWIIYLFTAIEAINVACVCFLFLWKKWAFFALCCTAVVTFGVNLYIGVGVPAIAGLAGVVITYLVLHQQWNLFDDF